MPHAEREESMHDIMNELAEREQRDGRVSARGWLWRQVVKSVPVLVKRSVWRGWTGFDPNANRMRPGGPMFESWIMDARFAARRLRRRPLYAILAVLTLALGVGGTAAIIGVARAVLFEPLPYTDEAELAVFSMPGDWREQEFASLRGQFPGFANVAAYRPEDVTFQNGTAPSRLLEGIASTAELFDVLGARAEIGRTFQAGDDARGSSPIAVLSYGFWQELGGDMSVLGRTVVLSGVSRTVVGVMPKRFWFPDPSVRLWVPIELDPEARSGNYTLIGRTPPGAMWETMPAHLNQLMQTLKDRFTYPVNFDKTKGLTVTPVRESFVGELRPALLATLTATGLILLIACANVAALMLGQVEGRVTELALRAALGAHRRRLVQQLVSESLLVGVFAGIAGTLLAVASFGLLLNALPLGAWAGRATLDWRIFAGAMVIALVASLLVALIPVIALFRGNLRDAIASARTAGVGGRGSRMEGGLVVVEVALAVLMTASAGLLVRSVTKLYAIDPGIEREGVAVLNIVMSATTSVDERKQTLRTILTDLENLPGARSTGIVQKIPLRGNGWTTGLTYEGMADDGARQTTFVRIGTPRYLETMGVAVKQGRTFNDADRTASEAPIMLNEAFVRKYFAGVDPIGKRVDTGFGPDGRVIGVVENVAEANLTDEAMPVRYMLYDHLGFMTQTHTVVIRTRQASEATGMIDIARRAIQGAAPSVAVQDATTMDRVFERAIGPARQVMILLGLLTSLALVLGAVGVYGVISHFATRRTRDWGIRMALGLAPTGVVRKIVGRGVALVAAGVAIGMVGVVLMAKVLSTFLYGVDASDPASLVAAAMILFGTGVVAAYVPALNASRVDPAKVLREQ